MNFFKQTISFLLYLGALFILGCTSQPNNEVSGKKENVGASMKRPYELADEYLNKLRNDKTDTIIFLKRTCIGCCDFFNIFWASNGNHFLKKFHADNEDQFYTDIIRLPDNEIFKQLGHNYTELKNSNIIFSLPYLDHYCYTQISIFTLQDSIETDRINDSDFEKDAGYMDAKDEKEKNEKYLKNIRSEWNNLLITIENQLANMKETSTRELKILRTRR